jgi:exo-beta-1,3-glucanase (GH17 family)
MSPLKRKLNCTLNGQWIGKGIAYGPQRDRHTPTTLEQPTRQELYEDLMLIAQQWNFIRVYRTSQTTENILHIIREKNLPIRVLMGLWVVEAEGDVNLEHNRHSVENAIRLANTYRDEVIGVSVGNEIFVDWSAHCIKNEAPIIEIIRHLRKNIIQPVTVADDYNFWNNSHSKEIVDEIDFLMLHVHPAWNSKSVEEATAFVGETYASIKAIHPHIHVILGECGWPTDVNLDKNGPGEQGALITGETSERAQRQFYKEYMDWIEQTRIPTLFFEVFDEAWKGGGPGTGLREVEKHWGVFTSERKPKAVIADLYPEPLLKKINDKAQEYTNRS